MEKILRAYQLVGNLSKFYDAMLTNADLPSRLALKFFWGLDEVAYQKFLSQAFAGVPKNFSGRLLEVPVGTGVLSLPRWRELNGALIPAIDAAFRTFKEIFGYDPKVAGYDLELTRQIAELVSIPVIADRIKIHSNDLCRCAGKEKSPKTENLPRSFQSGRKRNTFTTVAEFSQRCAIKYQ